MPMSLPLPQMFFRRTNHDSEREGFLGNRMHEPHFGPARPGNRYHEPAGPLVRNGEVAS